MEPERLEARIRVSSGDDDDKSVADVSPRETNESDDDDDVDAAKNEASTAASQQCEASDRALPAVEHRNPSAPMMSTPFGAADVQQRRKEALSSSSSLASLGRPPRHPCSSTASMTTTLTTTPATSATLATTTSSGRQSPTKQQQLQQRRLPRVPPSAFLSAAEAAAAAAAVDAAASGTPSAAAAASSSAVVETRPSHGNYHEMFSSSSSSSLAAVVDPFQAADASSSPLAKRRIARGEKREESFDARRALDRLGNAVARGAATGALLRGGLHAVSLLLAAAAPSRRRRRALAGAPGLAAATADSARYAAFLGAFAGSYVLLDEGISRGLGKKKTEAWRAAAAGACAAPTVLLLGRKQRHTSLALYLLLRGATLLVRVGNKPVPPLSPLSSSISSPSKASTAAATTKKNDEEEQRRIRNHRARVLLRLLLSPTRWEHGDTFLMCLACSQITYSWIIKPHTLPQAFVRFLNRHGGHELWFYEAARELASRPAGAIAEPVRALAGTPHEGLVGQ